ncbi:MAG: coenzyme F420-0:L-glutamate ligase, partial [Candidatus Berkelbacteria bacterium]|nr:coenzyme F420-0:L-glutamate ligase [Candidatus Berkelbacteria bacterium]
QSNVPTNSIALWPENPAKSAERIKKLIKKEFNANVGIILSDSHCLPLRLGTTAVAIAIAGFLGVIDLRNKADLFGRKLKITLTNVADQLASAANILMGEASEHIPAVLVKDAPIKLSSKSAKKLTRALIIPRNECLFREYNKKI